MKKSKFLWVLLAAAVSFGGCGSDDGGDDGAAAAAPAADEGKSVSVAITAAMGGEVASPSGTGKLAIPPGALAGDTTITLAVEAASAGSQSSVYNFGPDGTTFAVPATLTVAFDGTVPDGKKAVLGVLTDGAWTEIPGSTLAGGKVTGAVSHFSQFSVILVDGEAVLQSECSEVADNFSPCGGDPTGTWTINEICASNGAIGDDPFNGQCPGASLSADIEVSGTVTFADGKITPRTTTTSNITLHVPKSCLNDQPCSVIADGDDGWSCEESAENCDCSKSDSKTDDDSDVSDYVVEGNDIVSTDGDDVKHMPFCVNGNNITVSVPSDPGKPTVYYTGSK